MARWLCWRCVEGMGDGNSICEYARIIYAVSLGEDAEVCPGAYWHPHVVVASLLLNKNSPWGRHLWCGTKLGVSSQQL